LLPASGLRLETDPKIDKKKNGTLFFFAVRNNLTEKPVRAAIPTRLEAPSGRAVDPGDALAQNCVPCEPGATCAVKIFMPVRFISLKIPVLKRIILLNSNL
jgi:hypothetical protein